VAVVIDAFDLVVVAGAFTDIADFARAVPNNTFCTDGSLLRASFMVVHDREEFAERLGLPPTTLARVDKRPTLASTADWLETGHYAGVDAAWVRGAAPGSLVVPLHWCADAFSFETHEEAARNLEYLGMDNNVEVYRDKRTGKKVYTGRTSPRMDPSQATKLEALSAEGRSLVRPFLGQQAKLGFFEKRRVAKGVRLLEQVLQVVPDDWSTLWVAGMSVRALGEHRRALDFLRRAYQNNPRHRDVGREYAGQCLILGEKAEGVRVSRDLCERFPADAGLRSNLALALLLGGDLDEALDVAHDAHNREPSDAITKNLIGYIEAVKAGRKPRPAKLPGY
jgi:tetratricopeptide (TPR) repeat protein